MKTIKAKKSAGRGKAIALGAALALALGSAPQGHGAELLAYWDFNDEANPGAEASGTGPALTLQNAMLSPDEDGFSGQAGDRALDTGTVNDGSFARTDPGDHFDQIVDENAYTIVLWQVNRQLGSSTSSFWMHAPTSDGNQRGIQAHIPWSNGTIYFDQSGCCDEPGERLTVGTGVMQDQWQHFAFRRDEDGERTIWVDGVSVASSSPADPLDPFNGILTIGADVAGNNSFNGLIDEFGVFVGALTDQEIMDLAGGASIDTFLVDTDGDGLTDTWEIANLGEGAELDDGSTNIDFGPDGDPDNDGVSNLEERDRGTDPQNGDTDGDGLSDGVEDGGGTFVSAEMTGTSPTSVDSDGDGRPDGEEVTGNPTTDPTNPDTDGDGASDGAELNVGTDPNDPNSKPPLPVPLAYWSFDDEGAGDMTADLTGNGNDGTLNGGPEVVPGACGADGDFALQFDGIDDSVTTEASLLSGLAEFTMVGWAKFETDQANRTGLFGQNDAVEFGMINATTLHFWTAGGGAVDTPLGPSIPWTHIAVTGDPTERKVYLDGELAMSGSSPGVNTSGFTFNIGGDGIFDATGNFFNGCIDEVAVWDVVLSEEEIAQLASCELTPLGPRTSALNPLGLNVQNVGGQLELSWNSEPGQLYDVLSDLDLQPEIASWDVWDGNEMIAATPPRNSLTLPFPADSARYFAIRGYPTPPVKVFSDDFESGAGSWTTGTLSTATATEWELGTPDPGVVVGPSAAHSGSNVFGTDLDAQYTEDTEIFLRSPVIDLSNVVSATLIYWQFHDIEVTFDFAQVALLDASDDSEIAILEDLIEGTTSDWEEVSIDLPAEAIGKSVKVEFRLLADDFNNLAGFYIDDVCVEGSEP